MQEFEKEEQQRFSKEKESNTTGYVRLPLIPRLIVSVDRSGTVDQAKENIELAVEFFQQSDGVVVGVELGGNPTRNDFRMFQSVFESARKQGLP